MKIVDMFRIAEDAQSIAAVRCGANGERTETTARLAAEHSVEVFVNGTRAMRLVCTPTDLAPLVLGRLLTEGLIRGAQDVEAISVCEYGTRVNAVLRPSAPPMRAFLAEEPTCCTDNRTFLAGEADLTPVTPIAWREEWIFALARAFENAPPLYQKTKAVHSATLARGGEILYCCEDLGRHNAADKVIGCALRDWAELRECILFSSGRLPADMVRKAIRAGIPLLASKSPATDAGVALARRYALTLITSAKPDGFLLLAP